MNTKLTNNITFQTIGFIHSPFLDLNGMPIQPSSETSAYGTVELLPGFSPGLKDLEGFSHIILIYHLHESHHLALTVVPFLDSVAHGIFATRAPNRPNPIGISVVRLLKIEDDLLYVDGLDVLDGTPLLDIKPYVPEFDSPPEFHLGWMEKSKSKLNTTSSDARFSDR